MTTKPDVISERRSWIRAAAVVTLLMSPSPIVCFVLAERVLEHATVNYLRSRFDRGDLTLRPEMFPKTSANDAARRVWFEAHDVNLSIGLAMLVAFAASGVLGSMAVTMLISSRPLKTDV